MRRECSDRPGRTGQSKSPRPWCRLVSSGGLRPSRSAARTATSKGVPCAPTGIRSARRSVVGDRTAATAAREGRAVRAGWCGAAIRLHRFRRLRSQVNATRRPHEELIDVGEVLGVRVPVLRRVGKRFSKTSSSRLRRMCRGAVTSAGENADAQHGDRDHFREVDAPDDRGP